MDLARLAIVDVTSEEELYPVDHVFDGRNGPGGSCWMASRVGPQSIVLRFHEPLSARVSMVIESEERSDTCTQEIRVAGWCVDASRPFEGETRVFEYAPYGKSFHRGEWRLSEQSISHLCVRVTPLPSWRRASLTSIVLRSEPS